ncbi:MAG: MATE family efflux transporter [Deltaproteobacteria bacterium]|nr:MATE family efflux transporter [Deltaproteobacteria bacterium]
MRRLLAEAYRLAWPAVLQGLLLTLAFQVDRLLLGQYSADALASMQVSGPLLWSMVSVATAASAGTVAVVGRAYGAGDEERARLSTEAILAFALGVGVIAGGVVFLARVPITELLAGAGTGLPVRDAAVTYLSIVAPAAPLAFAGVLAVTALQASGDTRTPMIVSALAQTVNLGGDALLIFGLGGCPELGVQGAAIASAAAFLMQALVLLYILRRRRRGARLGGLRLGPEHWQTLRAILRPSKAAYVEKIIFHVGFLGFVALISRLGDVAMAANQALIAIESLGFITADGFGIAAGTLIASNLGRGDPERASQAGYVALGLAVVTLLAVSLLFVLLPEPLMSLFADEREIISLGARCLLVAAVAQPLMAAAAVYSSALRGAGDTATPMRVALVGPVFVRITATWLLAFHLGWGLVGVWVATTLDWTLRTVWLGLAYARGRWKSLEV